MTDPQSRAATEMAVDARRIDFTSTVNGKDYRLFISEPAGAPPAEGWPVIYLIDGNLHFGITVDTMRIQGRWPDTREAVIVGIGYPTESVSVALDVRTHDLTPPTPLEVTQSGWQRHMGMSPDNYGGMDAYLRMVEEEVKPRVAAATRVDPRDAILMGHSLGGLTTLAALFRNPNAFAQYVAISPSIWVNDRWVMGFVNSFADRVRGGMAKARLLLSAGAGEETEPPFPPYPSKPMPLSEDVYLDMMRSCAMVTFANELAERLEPLRGESFDLKFVIHPEEDHRSVVPAGIARGVYYTMYRP